jgi:hypothetical protein
MLFIFGFINFLDSQSTTTTSLPSIVVGGPQVGSSAVFSSFPRADGTPPANIASALLAPTTTRYVSNVTTGGGSDSYDVEAHFTVGLPRAQLLGFYKSRLEALGWQLYSTSTTSSGAAQLLFQKAGSDGWYWEAGVDASASSPLATAFTYRLFQASDFS